MSGRNLKKMFNKACGIDIREGKQAYRRYHDVMVNFSEYYSLPLDRVLAVFVSLSPNNDYKSNVRSMASVLDGYNKGIPFTKIRVSTYNHCRDRAFRYLSGEHDFLEKTKGLKVKSFYNNIRYPESHKWVTVDGHVKAAYDDKEMTMREALVGSSKLYYRIENAMKRQAKKEGLIPNQYQAILWFARKRTLNIVYNPQLQMFGNSEDVWNSTIHPDEVIPFEPYEDHNYSTSGVKTLDKELVKD